MRNRIEEALKHSRADYTEIRVEEKELTRVVYQGKDLEMPARSWIRAGLSAAWSKIRAGGW